MARRRHDEDDEEEYDDRPRRKRRRDGDDDIPPGTPRVYVHEGCGCKTKMPADVTREYLENPFELGEAPLTWCGECDEDVPWKKCHWAETRQNLYEYIDDLRAEMVISGDDPRTGPTYIWWAPIAFGAVLGIVAALIAAKEGLSVVLLGLLGAVVGALIGAGWMVREYSANRKESEEWNRKLLKRYYKRHPEAKQKKTRSRSDEDDE
jgi:hypothetical protein